MKIAAVLNVSISVGGGFNQALNAILQMKRLADNEFDFIVYTTVAENIDLMAKFGVEAKRAKVSWKDRLVYLFSLSQLGRLLQSKLRMIGNLESEMLTDGVNLVYYVQPHSHCRTLQHLNYIATVWDICHRDTPEFPEVRMFNEFYAREQFLANCLSPALLILTDSKCLSERIASFYNVDKRRLLAMPFSPAPSLGESFSTPVQKVMEQYHLEPGYFFYPAQFWAHKNHVRILQALAELKRKKKIEYSVVFAGSDKGNKEYIESVADNLGIKSQIRFLGFVPAEDLRGLYQGCIALIMPSYFGPTNLPPLEAFFIGKPVIYPDDFFEQTGSAALYFNKDDYRSLANAMESALEAKVARELVEKGYQRLEQINQDRREAELKLQQTIRQFARRRECWQ